MDNIKINTQLEAMSIGVSSVGLSIMISVYLGENVSSIEVAVATAIVSTILILTNELIKIQNKEKHDN